MTTGIVTHKDMTWRSQKDVRPRIASTQRRDLANDGARIQIAARSFGAVPTDELRSSDCNFDVRDDRAIPRS